MDRDQLQSLAASTAENLLSSSAGPLVRLLSHRARAPQLEFEVLCDFLAAAFQWVTADEHYCRQYCLPDRSIENERRTAAAADAKHAAREKLEAQLRQFGVHNWAHPDAVEARQRARQLLKHAHKAESAPRGTPENTRRRVPRRSFASPAASSKSPRSPARPSSQRQHTPIRSLSSRTDSAEESEVQLLKRQVRQLELRLQKLEQDNDRLSARVDELSSLEDRARIPTDRNTIQQLVEEAVSAATKVTPALRSSWDHDVAQNASDAAGVIAVAEKLVPSNTTSETERRLHWAATRIQAVHRGKINRSIGDE